MQDGTNLFFFSRFGGGEYLLWRAFGERGRARALLGRIFRVAPALWGRAVAVRSRFFVSAAPALFGRGLALVDLLAALDLAVLGRG